MRLLSCSNPQKVFNRFINDYVFVPCGKCAICRNRRASKYTNLLERERLEHRFTFFVTLTYDDVSIPKVQPIIFYPKSVDVKSMVFHCNRERDCERMVFDDFFPPDKLNSSDGYTQADIDYFESLIKYGGINYASKTDAQLFLKRLNKYIFDNVTHKFKNFRYFLVSEFGSTTFRGHFHAIFFVDDSVLADRFSDCISACWKYGITDTQFVENKACAYVAQYINKSTDLPYVYRHSEIRPFFLCSRRPFIGTMSQCAEDDAKIINDTSVTEVIRKGKDSLSFDVVPLQSSRQNRLFPKCPCFGSLSDSMRVECYTMCQRFSTWTLSDFIKSVMTLFKSDFLYRRQFDDWLCHQLSLDNFRPWLFDDYSFNFLRRIFYCSKKVARQACQFGLTVIGYIQKIFEYYNKKDIFMLSQQYEYQTAVSVSDADSISAMYPNFLDSVGMSVLDIAKELSSSLIFNQINDAEYFAYSNKKTHFKNAYLDSLALKRDSEFLFNLIKTYLYGKKCNETLEAFAASCAP